MKRSVSAPLVLCGILAVAVFFSPFTAFATEDKPLTPTRPIDTQRSTTISVPAGFIMTGPDNAECAEESEGALRYSAKHKTILLCDGKEWKMLKTESIAK